MTHIIDDHLLVTFLLQSFRYCLGRRTYAVSDCVEVLQKYWEVLPVFLQEQIQRDIKHALETSTAGDTCDIDNWREIIALKIKES